MSHPKFDPSASPEISAIVRSAVIVATLAFFTGAMMNAVLGHRDIAVVLALAAPLGVSAWGFVRAGHNEAALGLLCCVLVTVITLILVLLLLTYWPALTLWLPNLIMGQPVAAHS